MLDVILPKLKFFTRADTLLVRLMLCLHLSITLLSKTVFDNIENKKEVEDYIKVKSKSDLETENKEKTGIGIKRNKGN